MSRSFFGSSARAGPWRFVVTDMNDFRLRSAPARLTLRAGLIDWQRGERDLSSQTAGKRSQTSYPVANTNALRSANPDDQFNIGHADGCTELEPFRMSARLEPRIGNCKDIRVYARRRMRFSERWRRADHNFAVATIALMIFFLVVGFAAWLLDEKPSVAGVNAPAHGLQARSMP